MAAPTTTYTPTGSAAGVDDAAAGDSLTLSGQPASTTWAERTFKARLFLRAAKAAADAAIENLNDGDLYQLCVWLDALQADVQHILDEVALYPHSGLDGWERYQREHTS